MILLPVYCARAPGGPMASLTHSNKKKQKKFPTKFKIFVKEKVITCGIASEKFIILYERKTIV